MHIYRNSFNSWLLPDWIFNSVCFQEKISKEKSASRSLSQSCYFHNFTTAQLISQSMRISSKQSVAIILHVVGFQRHHRWSASFSYLQFKNTGSNSTLKSLLFQKRPILNSVLLKFFCLECNYRWFDMFLLSAALEQFFEKISMDRVKKARFRN